MRIIYVDVDTLRADHTSPYGYGRSITPNLQALADQGVTFERYYCSDAPCLPSRTALTSGQFGITNGVIGHFGEAARFRLDAGHQAHPTRPLLGPAARRARRSTPPRCRCSPSATARTTSSATSGSRSAPPTRSTTRTAARSTGSGSTGSAGTPHEDDWFLHLTYWEPHTAVPDGTGVGGARRGGRARHRPGPTRPPSTATPRSTARAARWTCTTRSAPRPSPVPHNTPDADPHPGRLRAPDQRVRRHDHVLGHSCFGELLATLRRAGHRRRDGDHRERRPRRVVRRERLLRRARARQRAGPTGCRWSSTGRASPTTCPPRRAAATACSTTSTSRRPCVSCWGSRSRSGWQGSSFAPAVRGERIGSREYLVLGPGRPHLPAGRAHPRPPLRAHLPPRLHEGRLGAALRRHRRPAPDREPDREEPELAARMRSHLAEWLDTVRRPARGAARPDADHAANRSHLLHRPRRVRAAPARHRPGPSRRRPRSAASRPPPATARCPGTSASRRGRRNGAGGWACPPIRA